MNESVQRHLEKMRRAIGDGLAGGGNGNPVSPKPNDTGVCEPDCTICGGSGYVRTAREIHDPEFGKIELCPAVDKWSLPGAVKYGLTGDEIRNLDWYSEIKFPDQAKPLIDRIQALLERGYGWLYIGGQHGLAKTCVLKAAIADRLRAGVEAAYVSMAQIFDDLRAGMNKVDPRQGPEARFEWWKNVPILAIDEFNKFNVTEYASERQFLLMNHRHEAAIRHRNSITIMASNVRPKLLPSYLSDRIDDGRCEVMWLEGESLRSEMDWTDRKDIE